MLQFEIVVNGLNITETVQMHEFDKYAIFSMAVFLQGSEPISNPECTLLFPCHTVTPHHFNPVLYESAILTLC
jgi:hypothetical protein